MENGEDKKTPESLDDEALDEVTGGLVEIEPNGGEGCDLPGKCPLCGGRVSVNRLQVVRTCPSCGQTVYVTEYL